MSSSTQGFYSRIQVSAKQFRHLMNLWPPFLAMRIHITHIAPDWRSLDVRMKLSLRNKNYVGSHFGGSLFSMTDPFHMLLMMHSLGRDYLVWDKAAHITFHAPGRGTVYAHFSITDEILDDIRANTAHGKKYEPSYSVDILDAQQKVIATVSKTLYIRKRAAK